MGSSASTPAAPAPIINPADVETSSGFHMLEIHAPTAGVGGLTILLAVFCFCAGAASFYQWKKHCGRRAVLRSTARAGRPADYIELGYAPPQGAAALMPSNPFSAPLTCDGRPPCRGVWCTRHHTLDARSMDVGVFTTRIREADGENDMDASAPPPEEDERRFPADRQLRPKTYMDRI